MKFGQTILLAGVTSLALGLPVAAEFVLQLPLGAKETYSRKETELAPLVAIEPFGADGLITENTPSDIRRSVWSFGGEQTLAEVQQNILDQLESSDYEVLLFCQTDTCGGFDFRFAIDVVPEPEMRVDLRDFRFVSARQNGSVAQAYVTFLLSKSPTSVYVQMTEYAPKIETVFQVDTLENLAVTPPVRESKNLSFVLEGVEFEVGSANLGSDPKGSIAKLAAQLTKNVTTKVLLVGHSDMSGALEANIALSEKRAQTVLDLLVDEHGIDKDRLSAHGVGFLSPRASNETEAGKAKNRRVEAVFSK